MLSRLDCLNFLYDEFHEITLYDFLTERLKQLYDDDTTMVGYALQNIDHISRNILIDAHFKHNKYSNKLKISNISKYIPKQTKSKDIVWYLDYNELKKNKNTTKSNKKKWFGIISAILCFIIFMSN